jgi:S1-C subfamily serine protease
MRHRLVGIAGRHPLTGWALACVGIVLGAVALAVSLTRAGEERTIVQTPIASSAAGEPDGLTVRDIYDRDAPGVVFIEAQVVQQTQSPFGFPQQQQGQSTGSGFVVDKDGYILTNAHVVEGASKVRIDFKKNKGVDAKVVGTDVSSDIALLKVKVDEDDLSPLKLGDSSDVRVGDPVVAIGNPFGLDRTVTTGIVSALQRELKAPNNFTIRNVIQTDAAINPGNSGGPLLDGQGRVIGINSQIATAGSGGNIGIGFAIPINAAKKIADELRKDGKVAHAYLGITGATIDKRIADSVNLPVDKGVLVQEVTGPAKKAGLRGGDTQVTIEGQDLLLGGDVIAKVNGKTVSSMSDVVKAVDERKPGDKMTLTVLRSGKQKEITVTLADRPASLGQGRQGQGGPGGEPGGPQIPGLP